MHELKFRELESVVQNARQGDRQAFDTLVYRFQDMAVGFAFSVVGDFHLAEDAAQEAFIQMHRDLKQLREPKAFFTWFRKVVYKQCDRITRRKQLPAIALDATAAIAAEQPSLSDIVEVGEIQYLVHDAILTLPEGQRQVITLFYISEYSQKEIAVFLDLPLTTVKKRLYDAKRRLKQRMTFMAKDYLQDNRPSKDEKFSEKVLDIIAPDRTKHDEAIYSLFEMGDDPFAFQWRAGRLANSHVDWETSRIGCMKDGEEEQVVMAMHVYDIAMRIGTARARTAGFNCEITHPAYMDQRSSLIERTARSSLDAMQAQGYDLAISFDDEAFWAKQGFVFGWRALQWHVSVSDLPETLSNLVLHRFEPNHRDDLAAIYNQTHQSLTGTAERPAYRRNKHPEMFMGWYWTDKEGHPAGYISGGADRYVIFEPTVQTDLDRGHISESIRRQFSRGSRWGMPPLSDKATCTVQHMGSQWIVEDEEVKCFIHKESEQLYGAVFDRPLFWVDEVAGDPDQCLQALGMLTRQWQCKEVFFDRLHYKSGVGKRIRQMFSCRIHTGTFGRSERSYVVRIINLRSLLEKLASELSRRLSQSPYANWSGNLQISLKEEGNVEKVTLVIKNGQIVVEAASEADNSIEGGQEIAQLILGSESPEEVVEMADIQVTGEAKYLLSVLFPDQHPQMENQAL
ncbi:MAG: sigma-70 family RNA polymerase sigma factor [Chloroflexota bacterium]